MFKFLFRKQGTIHDFISNMYSIVGVVLVWRGIWYIMDEIDMIFFGHGHALTAFLGIVIGVLLLYFPDRNFKSLERL